MLIYITVMLSDVEVMYVALSEILELLLFLTGTLAS